MILIIDVFSAVLSCEERQQLFSPVLPAFVRFCKAFPPLIEDVVGLLLQYGRISASENSGQPLTLDHGLASKIAEIKSTNSSPRHTTDLNGFEEDFNLEHATVEQNIHLTQPVLDVFQKILSDSILEKRLY